MQGVVKKGHLMLYTVYMLIGIIFLVFRNYSQVGDHKTANVMIGYFVVTAIIMAVMGTSSKIGNGVFEYCSIILMTLFICEMQRYFEKNYITLLYFMLVWMVGISFLRKGFFHVLLILQLCVFALFSFLPTGIILEENFGYRSFIVCVVLCVGADWIGCNIVNVILSVNAENLEKERSLDDMLDIVDAKHKEAKAATKAKSLFLSNMSHEIRTPINTILGMNEMIQRETDDLEIKRYSDNVKSASNLLLSLINDILDTSKIESGKMDLLSVEFNLADIINDTKNMLLAKMAEKKLDFIVEVDENLPARYIGDDVKLRQILINLLTNSVKYTISGWITLKIEGDKCEDKEILHISVSDTGIGIKEEDLLKLTEAFVRIEEKRNRDVEGTGLGMSIVCSYLKMMGSTLNVDSMYGQGSSFSFDLELPVVGQSVIGDIDACEEISDTEDNERLIAPEAKLLVVDDNSMNLMVVEELLSDTQVQLDTALSGIVALEKANENKYDLIFMDHMMPEMDGVETLQRIRDNVDGPNAKTPVLVLTANAISGAKEEYLKAGFDGFLAKPVMPDKLEEAIRKYAPDKCINSHKEEKKLGHKIYYPDFSNLPEVEGLDYDYGYLHIKDIDLYVKTIKDFITTMEESANYITECFEKIKAGDKEALNRYQNKMNKMKNETTLIGLLYLSGGAGFLTFAARNNMMNAIFELSELYVEDWLRYKDELTTKFFS